MWNTIVYSSGVSMAESVFMFGVLYGPLYPLGRSSRASQYAGPFGKVCLSVERSTAYFTSAEVTSVPSSNFTPLRSL